MATQKRTVNVAVATYRHADGSDRFGLFGEEIEVSADEADRLDGLEALVPAAKRAATSTSK